MEFPEELFYTETHEWIRILSDGRAVIGLTEYGIESIGEIVYVGLPDIDTGVMAGETFAVVESMAQSGDVYSGVDGVICEVNHMLADNPELINDSPYDAWLVKVETADMGEGLMDAMDYAEYVENL